MRKETMYENREATLKRLKRLEGQVRGIARMVEEDRYCVDVLTQIAAVRAALKGVEKLVIDDHASHCIEDALASGDRDDQRAKFTELLELLDKARG
ncbi:metal-sensitive transcriptional regulator [Yoonia sp. SS1-5]|uniref:Metal-sensitive transcriptional regulator n=1 Tax=Yoonia rhodophyticola TaxID=3137370 RepID=A0AAN0M7Y7_9RHOB